MYRDSKNDSTEEEAIILLEGKITYIIGDINAKL